MEYSNLCILVFIVLWAITLYWYVKRYQQIGAGGLLIISFLFYSVCSYVVFNDPTWGAPYKSLKLYPFVFLYLMIMLSILPILKWDRLRVDKFNSKSTNFVNAVCWFFIICTLARIGDFKHFFSGLQMMVISSGTGLEVYQEQNRLGEMSSGTSTISNIFAIFSNLLYDIAVICFLFVLHKKNKNKLLIAGMAISIVICILVPITAAQRGPTLERLLVLLIFFIAMKRFLPGAVKKIAKYCFAIFGALVSIPIAFITIARFADRGIFTSILCYFGQQNLYFNNYAFDNNGLRYGDRIFPVFKKMLGFNNVPIDYFQCRDKYTSLHINDEVFIGYVGDFMLDFGAIFTILIFAIYTIYTLSKLRVSNGGIFLYQLLPFFFLMHVCMYGGIFLFPFAFSDNYTIIVYVLMYTCLKVLKI